MQAPYQTHIPLGKHVRKKRRAIQTQPDKHYLDRAHHMNQGTCALGKIFIMDWAT